MTPAGMAMAGVAQSGHEAYRAHVPRRGGHDGWPSSHACTGSCRTPRRRWGPSVLTKRGATVGMAYTTCSYATSLRSPSVSYAHTKRRATLLKARMGPNNTMAWVLQELRLHQQAEREGVQRELLG